MNRCVKCRIPERPRTQELHRWYLHLHTSCTPLKPSNWIPFRAAGSYRTVLAHRRRSHCRTLSELQPAFDHNADVQQLPPNMSRQHVIACRTHVEAAEISPFDDASIKTPQVSRLSVETCTGQREQNCGRSTAVSMCDQKYAGPRFRACPRLAKDALYYHSRPATIFGVHEHQMPSLSAIGTHFSCPPSDHDLGHATNAEFAEDIDLEAAAIVAVASRQQTTIATLHSGHLK